MREIYLVNCCRTAVGSMGGTLKNTPAPEMGAIVIKEALKRAGVDAANVDEVMMGCTLAAGLGQNPARQAAVKAGVPVAVPSYTVSMVCGSGLKAIIEASRAIAAGDAEIIVAGGMENMSAAPYALPNMRFGQSMDAAMSTKGIVDTMVKDGLWDAFNNYHMGTTAENICDVWGITREELDAFGVASQQKTEAAQAAGKFDDEIVPVMVKVKKDMVPFAKDEFPKAGVTAEGLVKLKGAFPLSAESPNPEVVHTFEPTGCKDAADKGQQRVTAANASGINDGAAAIVLASGEAVEKLGLKPIDPKEWWSADVSGKRAQIFDSEYYYKATHPKVCESVLAYLKGKKKLSYEFKYFEDCDEREYGIKYETEWYGHTYNDILFTDSRGHKMAF